MTISLNGYYIQSGIINNIRSNKIINVQGYIKIIIRFMFNKIINEWNITYYSVWKTTEFVKSNQ